MADPPEVLLASSLHENGEEVLAVLGDIKRVDSDVRSASWWSLPRLWLKRSRLLSRLDELLQRRDNLWDFVVPPSPLPVPRIGVAVRADAVEPEFA